MHHVSYSVVDDLNDKSYYVLLFLTKIDNVPCSVFSGNVTLSFVFLVFVFYFLLLLLLSFFFFKCMHFVDKW